MIKFYFAAYLVYRAVTQEPEPMRFKAGVNPFGLSPELEIGLIIANDVYAAHGVNMTVTSLNDGRHSRKSKHYRGDGGDLRTHDLPDDVKPQSVADEIAKNVGPQYDVLLEGEGTANEHIHLEFDPKRID